MIRHLSRLTYRLTLLLIFLSGLAVLLARLLLPLAELYRGEIEQLAGEALGQPVQVGFMEAHWRGLGPRLILHNVDLVNPQNQRVTLRLSEIQVDIALLDSLRNRAVTTRRITLARPSILIKRRTNGSFAVEGLQGLEGLAAAPARADAGELFLLPRRIAVSDGTILWENQAIGAAPMRFTNVNLELFNDHQRHQIQGELSLPGAPASRLTLAADIQGDLQQPEGWSGDFYLGGEQLILEQLLRHRIPSGYAVPDGQLGMRLWSRWRDGRMQHLEGELQVQRLRIEQLPSSGAPRHWEVDAFGGAFQWLRRPRGWQLEIGDISYRHGGDGWPSGRIGLHSGIDPDGTEWLTARADFLRIQDLLGLATLFPLPDPALDERLRQGRPVGDIHDLRLELRGNEQWALSARATGLGMRPWQSLPGLSNLSAAVRAGPGGGSLEIDSRNTLIDTNGMFRAPLRLERLQGTLAWHPASSGEWVLTSPLLRASNQDLQTRSRLRLVFPATPGASPFIDLQTDFQDGDTRHAGRYYPTSIMPAAVVGWLDQAIGGGRVRGGSCLLRGPLFEFPFDQHPSGRFQVLFDVEGLDLDYQGGWPPLSGVAAQVEFLGNAMHIEAQEARILDTRIESLRVAIEDLAGTGPLTLDGTTEGPLADTLRLLTESPLAGQFGRLAEGIEAAGQARLDLDLTLPLDDEGEPRLDGRLMMRDAALDLRQWELPVRNIAGTLRFDQDRVRAKGIKGRLHGSPVEVDVAPEGGKATRLTARASLAAEHLRQRLPELPLDRLSGEGAVTLHLDIPHSLIGQGEATVALRIHSDLRGFAIDLPAPLGKTAESARELELETELGGARTPLRFRHAGLLSGALLIDPDTPGGVSRGEIRLGDARAELPQHPGVRIHGGWERLDLAPWLDLATPGGGTPAPDLRLIDLRFEQLRHGGLELRQPRLTLRRDEGGWSGELSSDLAEGRLTIPAEDSDQPLRLDLERLNLAFDPQSDTPATPADPGAAPDPTRLPAIDASVKAFQINGHPYGQLNLKTERVARGMRIEQFGLDAPGNHITASGDWILDAGGAQHTRLIAALTSDDFGNVLEDLGFNKNIDGASAEFDMAIDWPGSPLAFSREHLDGRLTMQLGSGRFLAIDPGVGRIFGLLNVSTLFRRLTLDFKDVLQEGFAFDDISGTFILERGDAYTEDFRINSPSSTIEIAGRVGLGREDFDQMVTVTPQLSSNLTMAGAVTGGPVVGAALYLVQKLVGKEVDKVSRVQYIVTGPWEEPSIEKHRTQADPETPREGVLGGFRADTGQPPQTEWVLPTPDGKPRFDLSVDTPWEPEREPALH
ncbi:MAG: TIGR02099 family protein [gamma proteobacterium symbiont of Phacoides pectinatus]